MKFVNLKNLIRRRPLIFNSIVYGSFYLGAEFAQQSYNRKYQIIYPATIFVKHKSTSLSKKQEQGNSQPERLIALGATVTPYDKIQPYTETIQITSRYDWKQLQRYAIVGCFVTGPILHGWYKWLDRIFRGTTIKVIMVKLLFDQFILTPTLLTLFFISMSCLEGKNDIIQECQMKFVQTFQASCLYWIPVQFVNFRLVPPALRVLYVSVAAFCWANILCYLKRLPLLSHNAQADGE